MGIELLSTGVYEGVCDVCGTHSKIKAKRPNTLRSILYQHGWRRIDYINIAPHYAWACNRCPTKQLEPKHGTL